MFHCNAVDLWLVFFQVTCQAAALVAFERGIVTCNFLMLIQVYLGEEAQPGIFTIQSVVTFETLAGLSLLQRSCSERKETDET
jgi:hypothetical protein